jgi:hypothetical protein
MRNHAIGPIKHICKRIIRYMPQIASSAQIEVHENLGSDPTCRGLVVYPTSGMLRTANEVLYIEILAGLCGRLRIRPVVYPCLILSENAEESLTGSCWWRNRLMRPSLGGWLGARGTLASLKRWKADCRYGNPSIDKTSIYRLSQATSGDWEILPVAGGRVHAL